jgi:natural product precursor
MKQIKKIVLRDATKLTNSEMKSIRGGYEPEEIAPISCSATCDNGTGTIIGYTFVDCSEFNKNDLECIIENDVNMNTLTAKCVISGREVKPGNSCEYMVLPPVEQ